MIRVVHVRDNGGTMRAVVPVLVIAFFISSVAVAGSKERAVAAFEIGVAHFKAERYEEAAEAFRRANELHPSWKLQFNIGQCEAVLKRYGVAMEAFEIYLLEGGDDVPPTRQEQVRLELERLRDLSGEISVLGPEGAKVLVDAQQRAELPLMGPLRVAAGYRTIRVVRGGVVLVEKKIRLATRGRLELKVDDPAPAATEATVPRPPKDPSVGDRAAEPATGDDADAEELDEESGRSGLVLSGWVTAGIGAVALIGGGIAGGVALSKEGALEASCEENTCTAPGDHDLHDSAAAAALAADILIPAGGAILAAGVVMIIAGKATDKDEERPETARIRARPVLGQGGAGLLLEGRF